MKTLLGTLLIAILSTNCIAQNTNNQTHNHSEKMNEKEVVTKKKVLSPHTETMAMIGDAHIHIDYSSPGVRGRIIFGGLVGYNTIWQAGAHKATWIETNKDLIIDGKTLPAGKYGFFTIPSNDEWTIMINKNWDQHGKDEYDEKDDVIRFKVKSILSATTIEHLEYKVKKISDTEGAISLAWEKVLIDFNFTVKQ